MARLRRKNSHAEEKSGCLQFYADQGRLDCALNQRWSHSGEDRAIYPSPINQGKIVRKSLSPRDKCDRCGVQAKVRASFLSGDLYFCVHHARQFDVKQTSFSVEVENEEVENMLVLHRF